MAKVVNYYERLLDTPHDTERRARIANAAGRGISQLLKTRPELSPEARFEIRSIRMQGTGIDIHISVDEPAQA